MTDGSSGIDGLRIDRDVSDPAMAEPRPPRRWRQRWLVPGLLVAALLALLGPGILDAIAPLIEVEVVPCVARAGGAEVASVSFQATGWIEPDPFAIFVSALTDGVIAEVLVLEGERVERDQIVARLVRDDARIALDAANAEVALHDAEVGSSQAELAAARELLETLIVLRSGLEIASAGVRELDAEVARTSAVRDAAAATVLAQTETLRRKRGLVASGAVSALDVAVLEHHLEAERNVAAAADAARALASA